MSCDFLVYRPRSLIRSPDDLNESTTAPLGAGEILRRHIHRLLPSTKWNCVDGVINGCYLGEESWYEFSIREEEAHSFHIKTSRLNRRRSAIELICKSLHLLAFDTCNHDLIGTRTPTPARVPQPLNACADSR